LVALSVPHEDANIGASIEIRSRTMRTMSLLRASALALSLTASMGAMSAAFAADAHAAQTQQQAATASPYDSQDFVVPANNIN
jgi:hypothetical protein